MEDATRDVSAENGFTPSLISWNLTKRCNLRCPHCYIEAGAKAEGARIEDELTTDECLATIDDMKALGTEMLILTGGEPLLRKDIFDIASYASSQGMWVVMGTNGVLINEPVAQKMVECGVKGVGISIDSTNPEVHNTFRGGPDAWEHSVRALRTCRDYGLEVLVQTTVMEMNYDEIPAMLEFARDQGAWSFNLYFLIQTGRGQQMNDLSAARTEEIAYVPGKRAGSIPAHVGSRQVRSAFQAGRLRSRFRGHRKWWMYGRHGVSADYTRGGRNPLSLYEPDGWQLARTILPRDLGAGPRVGGSEGSGAAQRPLRELRVQGAVRRLSLPGLR